MQKGWPPVDPERITLTRRFLIYLKALMERHAYCSICYLWVRSHEEWISHVECCHEEEEREQLYRERYLICDYCGNQCFSGEVLEIHRELCPFKAIGWSPVLDEVWSQQEPDPPPADLTHVCLVCERRFPDQKA